MKRCNTSQAIKAQKVDRLCLELRGRQDNLHTLSVAEKPNHFISFLGSGRMPFLAPPASKKGQVTALVPGIQVEVMDATILVFNILLVSTLCFPYS